MISSDTSGTRDINGEKREKREKSIKIAEIGARVRRAKNVKASRVFLIATLSLALSLSGLWAHALSAAVIDTAVLPLIKKHEISGWRYQDVQSAASSLLLNPEVVGKNNVEEGSALDTYILSMDAPAPHYIDYSADYGSYHTDYHRYEYASADQWISSLIKYENSAQEREWHFSQNINDRRSKKLFAWLGDELAEVNKDLDQMARKDELMSRMGIPSFDQAALMVRWLHGDRFGKQDSRNFNESGRSGMAFVGVPFESTRTLRDGHSAWAEKLDNENSAKTLFVQTNGGMLHAIKALPGDSGGAYERWAFIPPNALEHKRLAGLQFALTTSADARLSTAKNITHLKWLDGNGSLKTNPGYVLDGPLSAVDMDSAASDGITDTGWGHYLFGMMGRGGAGMYALHVDDDNHNPKFLWAVENNMYSYNTRAASNDAAERGAVHFWNGIGKMQDTTTTTPYTALGATAFDRLGWDAPKPVFGAVKSASGKMGSSGTGRNFMVLGGGLQYQPDLLNAGTIGSAIYLVDPLTGKLLRTFTGEDVLNSTAASTVGRDPEMGMIVTPPSIILDNSEGKRWGRFFFTADHRGRVFRGKFAGDAWHDIELTEFATLRGLNETNDNPAWDAYPIPHQLLVALDTQTDQHWIYGGTADIPMRTYGEDATVKLVDDERRPKDYATSSNPNSSARARDYDDATLTTNPDMGKNGGAKANDWNRKGSHFVFGIRNVAGTSTGHQLAGSKFAQLDVDSNSSYIPATDILNYDGWVMRLHGTGYESGGTGWLNREYVSAQPVLFGGYLYIATFSPGGTNYVKDASRLYRLNPLTGSGTWGEGASRKENGHKALFLEGLKITAINPYTQNNKTHIMLSGEITNLYENQEVTKSASDLATKSTGVSALVQTRGNYSIAERDLYGSITSSDVDYIIYWRDAF